MVVYVVTPIFLVDFVLSSKQPEVERLSSRLAVHSNVCRNKNDASSFYRQVVIKQHNCYKYLKRPMRKR